MDSAYFNMQLDGFEKVNWDKSPTQAVSSTSELSLLGVSSSTLSSGGALDLSYLVDATGGAQASSVGDGTSAFNSSVAIGTKKSTFDAAAALGFDTMLDVSSVVDAFTSTGDANAYSVGFSIGMDRGALTSGSSLDAVVSADSSVSAIAQTTSGDALSVASNDASGLTGLSSFTSSEDLSLSVQLDLANAATASTTNGASESVGWVGSTALENTAVTASGLGLIDLGTHADSQVSAEAVTGAAVADAFTAITGVSGVNFNFADTNSTLAVDMVSSTTSTATSVFGQALSNLTSSVLGFFGQNNQMTGAQSVDALVSDSGFAEAASVGGAATASVDQSVVAVSGYTLTTTDALVLNGRSTLDSAASASVVEA